MLQAVSPGRIQSRGNESSTLFGALVRHRVSSSSVDMELGIPDLHDSPDVIIPTFHKTTSMEVSSMLMSAG